LAQRGVQEVHKFVSEGGATDDSVMHLRPHYEEGDNGLSEGGRKKVKADLREAEEEKSGHARPESDKMVG